MSSADFDSVLASLGRRPAERTKVLGQGRNSRVHRVQSGGEEVVIKEYYREGHEHSPRQEREYRALSFLWGAGIRSIPEPIGNDFERGILVMSLLPGIPALQSVLCVDDAMTATAFLGELRGLSAHPRAAELDDASDAAFSLGDLLRILEARVEALENLPSAESDAHAAAAELVAGPLVVSFRNAAAAARKRVHAEPIPREARTLSPSDFGFHNAVRTPEGGLCFVDFEHFGWDDPAKTIADFVLHPGMDSSRELRKAFTEDLLQRFSSSDGALGERTLSLGPLYAVKWATILLNEFLPRSAARRSFAASDTTGDKARLFRQIDKARQMLAYASCFGERAGL